MLQATETGDDLHIPSSYKYELFDLINDEHENKNIYTEHENDEIVNKMKKVLGDLYLKLMVNANK